MHRTYSAHHKIFVGTGLLWKVHRTWNIQYFFFTATHFYSFTCFSLFVVPLKSADTFQILNSHDSVSLIIYVRILLKIRKKTRKVKKYGKNTDRVQITRKKTNDVHKIRKKLEQFSPWLYFLKIRYVPDCIRAEPKPVKKQYLSG